MVAVSIVLNVPRFFRIDIIGSPSHNSTNVTSSRPYTYTALAENFYFKVGRDSGQTGWTDDEIGSGVNFNSSIHPQFNSTTAVYSSSNDNPVRRTPNRGECVCPT